MIAFRGVRLPAWVSDIAQLIKIKITLSVTFTAAVGFLANAGAVRAPFLGALLGTFFLACASAALNQVQDCDLDRLLERTRERPLPAGRMTRPQALLLALVLTATGSALLESANPAALATGLFTMAWYNLVYTPLKRISAFAVLPGALTGALPPLIGWCAAGGALTDRRAIALAAFLFLCQVPHSWLLCLIHQRDGKRGVFRTPVLVFSGPQMRRVTFSWLVSAVAAGLLLPLYSLITWPYFSVFYLLIAAGILAHAAQALLLGSGWRAVFRNLNILVALVLCSALGNVFVQ